MKVRTHMDGWGLSVEAPLGGGSFVAVSLTKYFRLGPKTIRYDGTFWCFSLGWLHFVWYR